MLTVVELIVAPEELTVAESIADLSDEIPDDPDEAIEWLEQMVSSEPEVTPEIVEEPVTPVAPQDVVAARVEAEARLAREEALSERPEAIDKVEEVEAGEILEDAAEALARVTDEDLEASDIPEDPDEAIAWLEELAARQGDWLDDEPVVETPLEDESVPAWLAAEEGEVQRPQVADEEAVLTGREEPGEVVSEERPIPAEAASEEAAVFEEETFLEELDFDFTDEDLDESLPDWLAIEVTDESGAELSWEEAAADIPAWLAAEDEVTQKGPPSAELTEEPVEEEEPDSEPAPALEQGEQELPARSSVAEIDDEHLKNAREALQAGEYEVAADAFEAALSDSEQLPVLIAELESVTDHYPDQPRLRRLLGDVYMENGQLQKALECYREALDLL